MTGGVHKPAIDALNALGVFEGTGNADALAAFDSTDPIPGNGVADIFGCTESWTCDNIIENMIAFSGWDNIAQVTAGYDTVFDRALDNVNAGIPTILYAWTPSA